MARAEKRKRDRAILECLSTCRSFSFLPDRHHHGLRKNLTSPSGVTEMCADRGLLPHENLRLSLQRNDIYDHDL